MIYSRGHCQDFLCFPAGSDYLHVLLSHFIYLFPLFINENGEPNTLHNQVNLPWPTLPVTSCSEQEMDTSCCTKNSMLKLTARFNPSITWVPLQKLDQTLLNKTLQSTLFFILHFSFFSLLNKNKQKFRGFYKKVLQNFQKIEFC